MGLAGRDRSLARHLFPLYRYYAVCYLNQIVLSQRDMGLANTLTDVYFTLFHWLTKNGEVQTKMLSAILTGINRAFPFADVNDEVIVASFRFAARDAALKELTIYIILLRSKTHAHFADFFAPLNSRTFLPSFECVIGL